MITFLEGTIAEKKPTRLVVNVGGVGYEVLIPLSSHDKLPPENETCRILTYDYVREDQHTLYGFATEAERKMFILLTSVSGIGPKIALTALSGLTARNMTAAVVSGDAVRLSSIPGIGRKTAERMIVELRDKIGADEALQAGDTEPGGEVDIRLRDAVLALVSLGYREADARAMVKKGISSGTDDDAVEDVIRRALST